MKHVRFFERQGPVAFLLALSLMSCSQGSNSSFEFALFGDNPYGERNVEKAERLIEDVNQRASLKWVIHLGDIKGGAQSCSDEVLRGRYDLFQTFEIPFIFTPGDNDWFDCVREPAGSWNDYERLEFLRSLFFANPEQSSGGQPLVVRSQSADAEYPEFVENAMWSQKNIVFATVHLIRLTRPPSDSLVATRRMEAAMGWIKEAFSKARSLDSPGLFLATQVDPWAVWGNPGIVRGSCETCLSPKPGIEALIPLLIEESASFEGQVVLAVGDTHVFRVDKPLYREDGTLVENFTRVEVFGEPQVHWVRVEVDPTDRQVFSFHQEIVVGN